MGSANGERNKSKSFEGPDGEPLNVTEGDRKGENLSLIGRAQINVDHVSIVELVGELASPYFLA